jgi:Molybdate transporter of MFS superfamily
MISNLSWFGHVDCRILAVICSLGCAYSFLGNNVGSGDARVRNSAPRCSSLPAGLSLFLVAAALAICRILFGDASLDLTVNDNPLRYWKALTWNDWKVGFVAGAVPQLPLSTLNSVVSVCALADLLYPEKRRRQSSPDLDSETVAADGSSVLSPQEACMSVGIMNVLLVPFGAMPSCHGAGGLSAQHKFGARHGAAVVFLGVCKIIVAIVARKSLFPFLQAFPSVGLR